MVCLGIRKASNAGEECPGERRDEVERWTRAGSIGPCGRGRTLNFILSVIVAGVGVEQKRDV